LKILRARGWSREKRRRAIFAATPVRIVPLAMALLVDSASAALAIPRPSAENTPAALNESVAWAFCGVMLASTSWRRDHLHGRG
jgi:hypothetical protein